jgi:hypothetical protein
MEPYSPMMIGVGPPVVPEGDDPEGLLAQPLRNAVRAARAQRTTRRRAYPCVLRISKDSFKKRVKIGAARRRG